MPKKAPQFGTGGTEKDLDKQIEDDIMDLKLQMDTETFGEKALAEDKKKEEKKR